MIDSIKNMLPEIYVCVFSLIALIRGMFSSTDKKAFSGSFMVTILTFFAAIAVYMVIPSNEIYHSFDIGIGEYLFTSYNLIVTVKILILICAIVLSFLLKEELKRLNDRKYEYVFLLSMSVLGGFIAVSSFNLFVVFIGIELLSFCLYFLMGAVGDGSQKIRATGRYFVVSCLATGFMLYGLSLVYMSCQSVDIGTVGSIIAKSGDVLDIKLYLGLSILILGIMVKLGIFPFQYYLPAIANKSNLVILGIVITIVKIVFLSIVMHLILVFDFDSVFLKILSFIMIIAIIVSAIMSYNEENLNRLIAYSSIHNTGFVLLGILMQDYKLFLYYQTLYVLLMLSFISFLISFKIDLKPVKTFKDLAKSIKFSVMDKIFCFVVLLLISGSPPLGMFFGKFLVVKELIYKEQYLLSFFAALGGVMMIGCFLRVLKEIFVYYNTKSKIKEETRSNKARIMSYILLLIAIAFSFTFLY